MKRFTIFFIFCSLLVVSACSTTNNVGSRDALPQDVHVASQDVDNSNAIQSEQPDLSKKTKKTSKKGRAKSTSVLQLSEDDDISSLIGNDYYKDFDIPIVFNDAVKYFIQYFTSEKRKAFSNWLKRSRYYIPAMKEILKEQGLPEDLVYLAMIESGFNPKAYSPASACGPWQFIYETGGRYGLKVNYWIDERRDPEKSTVAAAKYLRDLFNQFGCWYLAAAGYNSGERRVERAIEKHNTNDFWEIVKYNTLPRETREYIPKLIAAAIIAKDPEKFGFGAIGYDEPVRFSKTKVPAGTPLKTIAKSASMDLGDLRAINPEILRGITPPDTGNYEIKLPLSVDLRGFDKNLDAALVNEKKIAGYATYKVRKKDTLARILKKYRLNYEDIQLVNSGEGDIKIKPGMVLAIPMFKGGQSQNIVVAQKTDRTEKRTDKKSSAKSRVAAAERSSSKRTDVTVHPDEPENSGKQEMQQNPKKLEAKTYHNVKKGETLSSISNKYGVDISSLRATNRLKNDKVYPGMKLKLVKSEG